MKKKFLILAIAFLMITFSLTAGDLKFGKDFSVKETTKISTLLEKGNDFLKAPVKVEGTIVGVCSHKGCWIQLAGDKEFQKLFVKVKDGVMVFPMTAKGKHAVVEGMLIKKQLTKEQTIKKKEHECKQKGEKFDASCVKVGEVVYQLNPTAVIVKEK